MLLNANSFASTLYPRFRLCWIKFIFIIRRMMQIFILRNFLLYDFSFLIKLLWWVLVMIIVQEWIELMYVWWLYLKWIMMELKWVDYRLSIVININYLLLCIFLLISWGRDQYSVFNLATLEKLMYSFFFFVNMNHISPRFCWWSHNLVCILYNWLQNVFLGLDI